MKKVVLIALSMASGLVFAADSHFAAQANQAAQKANNAVSSAAQAASDKVSAAQSEHAQKFANTHKQRQH
jgi:hypothetical protein